MEQKTDNVSPTKSTRTRKSPNTEFRTAKKPKYSIDEGTENYYLDKTCTKTTTSLETIYEDPEAKGQVMSKKKYKRITILTKKASTSKIKIRNQKAKKVGCKFFTRQKISMEEFLKKLEELEIN